MNTFLCRKSLIIAVFLLLSNFLSAAENPSKLTDEAWLLNSRKKHESAAEKFLEAASLYESKNWRKADCIELAYWQYSIAGNTQKAAEIAIQNMGLSHTLCMQAFVFWHKNGEFQKIYDAAKRRLTSSGHLGSSRAGNFCGAMLLGANGDAAQIAETVSFIESHKWGYIAADVVRTGPGLQHRIWKDEDTAYWEKHTVKILEKAVFKRKDIRKYFSGAIVDHKISAAASIKDMTQRVAALQKILKDYPELRKKVAFTVANHLMNAKAYNEAEKLYRELGDSYYILLTMDLAGRHAEAFAEAEKMLRKPENRTDSIYAFAVKLALNDKVRKYDKALVYNEKKYQTEMSKAKKFKAFQSQIDDIKARYYANMEKAYYRLGNAPGTFDALDNYLKYSAKSWDKKSWVAPHRKALYLISWKKFDEAQKYISDLDKLSSTASRRDKYQIDDKIRELKRLLKQKREGR